MATVAVSVFQPASGAADQALGLMKEGQEIIAGLGSRVQVAMLVRGGIQGQLYVIVENDDTGAYGATLDKLYSNQGYQQFMSRAQATKAATPIRSVDYVEIPGCELAYDQIESAGAIMASLFVIRDGRMQDSLERIKRWKALTEKHGGKARAMQAVASDPFGVTATVAYYDNFSQWGKVGAAMAADPEWQAFTAEIRGASASADFLRTTLLRVV